MIKTIIFDNNGVLTAGNHETTYKMMADFLKVDMDFLKSVWDDASEKVDDGRISTDDFSRNVISKLGRKADISDFKSIRQKSYHLKDDVVEFVSKLKDNYELALLTNFGDDFDECNRSWEMEKIFDDRIFVSAKIGMKKPDKEIFVHVLDKLCRKPEETIFIDDNFSNVESARQVGMNAILFESLSQLKNDLKSLLNHNA